jgi:AcrR family transcriptional regulator
MTAEAPPSRDQILDAAETHFAKQGYARTTIKQIGTASGLNPALLYYYFSGKEELYQAVLERIVGTLVSRGGAALDAATDPAEAIRKLIAAQVEFLLSRPNLPPLMIREMVDHEARHAHDIILDLAAGLFQRLCRVIEAGQRAGTFRPEIEPRFAAVSSIAQVVYFIVARPAIALFFGLGEAGVSADTTRQFGRHAGDFAVRALTSSQAAP